MVNFFRKEDTLLTPANCSLLLIDYQPQMLFAVKSIDNESLVNNAVGLAKAARIFKVPTILTSISQKSFNGKIFAPLQKVLAQSIILDRTTMNPWEDPKVIEEVRKTKREKIVIAGLWTEVCVTLPAIKALESGYSVYVVADACGATTALAQQTAMQRMVQAGAIPITWLQFLLELQRDWAREETCAQVLELAMEHAGTYGVGIEYAASKAASPAEESNFVI
ncbi:MAG TPA: hydrolase [Gammaproteobacteria bacterium]|nr:hydrolase [Gammaproteobacteria bacterium]